jgi:hypothetical protein
MHPFWLVEAVRWHRSLLHWYMNIAVVANLFWARAHLEGKRAVHDILKKNWRHTGQLQWYLNYPGFKTWLENLYLFDSNYYASIRYHQLHQAPNTAWDKLGSKRHKPMANFLFLTSNKAKQKKQKIQLRLKSSEKKLCVTNDWPEVL